MTLGKKLALQRKAVGLTQEEVALKVRVTTQTLADWENNIPIIKILVHQNKNRFKKIWFCFRNNNVSDRFYIKHNSC
jgi:DNA-binding XRE family transcriptional regulator